MEPNFASRQKNLVWGSTALEGSQQGLGGDSFPGEWTVQERRQESL